MRGLITLDFGNTHATAGVFSLGPNPALIKKIPLSELQIFLSQLGMSAHNSQLVLSDVKPREEELQPLLESGFLLTRVKDYWRGKKFHGMNVNYTETLGEDRLISAFYAYKKLKANVLVIDAGTFVTMDVVTTNGFEGGYIIPGIETYLSTYQRGENLKNFSLTAAKEHALPHDSETAMAGSYSAFAALARKLIQEHQIQKVLITGGASSLWEKLLGELNLPSVVETHPDLIHSALLYWMTTQIEPL
jgi:pantothenate kinase type III